MKDINVTIQTRIQTSADKDRVKLLNFAKGQFEAMRKRNLRVPVELYQL